jgi:hypothetical protein
VKGVVKDWEKAFNKAMPELAGRNKIYPLGDKSGGPVVTGTGPLLGALVSVEKSDPNQIAPKNRDAKSIKTYEKDVESFRKARKDYSNKVKKAIADVDKREHTKAYRELKTLHTTLGAVAAKIENHLLTIQKQKELDKIGDKGTKKVDKLRGKGKEEEALQAKEDASLKKNSTSTSSNAMESSARPSAWQRFPTPRSSPRSRASTATASSVGSMTTRTSYR